MFVLNPDPYLLPSYRVSPFTTSSISRNHKLNEDKSIDDYFHERFNGKQFEYSLNGRDAINLALSQYSLQKDDIVTILTTSENFYISGCVTNEIEKFCKWSRKVETDTKVIFVNHEFGYPYKNIRALKKLDIPIIEDCAHSFFSIDENNTIGTIGDFVIYSFPKMFPLQIGGLLVSNKNYKLSKSKLLGKSERQYIKNVLSHDIKNKEEIIEKRLQNYSYLSKEFENLGFKERFKLENGIVPGVFMFQKGTHQIELSELKKYLHEHGIQCSVFYGEETFFIPVHQALNECDLAYFVEVIKSYIKLTIS